MGYTGFSLKKKSRVLLARGGGAGTGETAVEAMQMRRIIHEASLARFLLFVNQSSSVCR